MQYLSHISPSRLDASRLGNSSVHIPQHCEGLPVATPADEAANPLSYTLFALYEEFAVEATRAAEIQVPAHIPLACNQTASELALAAVEQLIHQCEHLSRSGKYLIYAHETPEPSFYLTPALMLKKCLSLSQIQPVAISHCGSVSLACAVELLACLNDGASPAGEGDSVIVVSDQLAPPMPRFVPDCYPFGDAAVACVSSPSRGTWEVAGLLIEEWPYLTKHPYSWDNENWQVHNETLIQRSLALLERYKQEQPQPFAAIRYAIVQHISEAFVNTLTRTLAGVPVYNRSFAAACNLLGSDCLISMHELEQQVKFLPGDTVLLVMAGPLSRVSLMLLRRTDYKDN